MLYGRVAALGLLVVALGCDRRTPPSPTVSSARPAPSTRPRGSVGDDVPRKLKPPIQRELPEPEAVGLPAGCRLELPMRRLELPAGDRRFLAASANGTASLAAAIDFDADDVVDEAAAIALAGGPTTPLPWSRLETPPPLALGEDGWFAAVTEPMDSKNRRLLAWTSGGSTKIGHGDHLEALDALCRSPRCAVLTTLATRTGGSGASVFVTTDTARKRWAQIDLRPESKGPWSPYAIASLSNAATVALTSPTAVEFWLADGERPKPIARFSIEHELYLILPADEPMAIVRGAGRTEGCTDSLPVRVLRANGHDEFELPGSPGSLVSNRLGDGFLLSWVGPTGCADKSRNMVHALVLDGAGRPMGSAMAVAEGSGFALATHESSLDLFLSDPAGVLWVRGHCRAAERPPPTPSRAVPSSVPKAP